VRGFLDGEREAPALVVIVGLDERAAPPLNLERPLEPTRLQAGPEPDHKPTRLALDRLDMAAYLPVALQLRAPTVFI